MPSASPIYDAINARNRFRLEELGKRLRLGRQRRSWTQKELAAKSGISEGTIKKIEAGNPRVPLGFWVQLMDCLALAHELEQIALPEHDRVGSALEETPVRQRVRNKAPEIDFDLEDEL